MLEMALPIAAARDRSYVCGSVLPVDRRSGTAARASRRVVAYSEAITAASPSPARP
ncbi:hypothetical protein OWR29_35845 [Actinoplanes sp. Pm04-4]|uniref:Uncharacterized protein n=1 Tax=Paractinoplanes pyxinae TaxID=2997416 RepID=A0ABT4BAB3_9ACTN|nr:hypothetical protein [Actinoplanes pyxinae]MCY1143401.1 hypothetical protein [Actinoplanes pyxinae]